LQNQASLLGHRARSRKAERPALAPELRRLAREILGHQAELGALVRAERYPDPPANRRRCAACEYRRFCNDVWRKPPGFSYRKRFSPACPQAWDCGMISNAQKRCCAHRRPALGLGSPKMTFDEGRLR